jgi:hypothetical protein
MSYTFARRRRAQQALAAVASSLVIVALTAGAALAWAKPSLSTHGRSR